DAAHPGIVAIIPEVKDMRQLMEGGQKQIDLSKGMEALFRDYFRHEKGQEPNEEIMQLFNEILAEEE
ncbi:MAG: Nuclease SbcCD, D subunit, partial [Proteiniphilum acetatigenes]